MTVTFPDIRSTDPAALHALLVDAIIGRGFLGYGDAGVWYPAGLAVFNGNQHNESWTWSRPALRSLSVDALYKIYYRINT